MINFRDFNVDIENVTAEHDGITFDAEFLCNCMMIYERITTAAFLMDTYEYDETKAWKLADIVREKMANYPGLTEEDAIDEAIEEYEDDEEG